MNKSAAVNLAALLAGCLILVAFASAFAADRVEQRASAEHARKTSVELASEASRETAARAAEAIVEATRGDLEVRLGSRAARPRRPVVTIAAN